MRSAISRSLLVVSFVIATALTVAGVIAQLSIPGPLVPVAEGLLFLVLLGWVHWQYLSGRSDSPAYQQHLRDLKDFARSARDSALYMQDAKGYNFTTTEPIDTSGPRAKDFLAHYPEVAAAVDEWNRMANGYRGVLSRFAGQTHKTSEQLTGTVNSGFPRLLQQVGEGDLAASDITWRIVDGRLESSWERDVDEQPVFVPVVTAQATDETQEKVQRGIAAFLETPLVRDRRARREVNDRLRPVLLDAFERAEIAVVLKGRCEHCPN